MKTEQNKLRKYRAHFDVQPVEEVGIVAKNVTIGIRECEYISEIVVQLEATRQGKEEWGDIETLSKEDLVTYVHNVIKLENIFHNIVGDIVTPTERAQDLFTRKTESRVDMGTYEDIKDSRNGY